MEGPRHEDVFRCQGFTFLELCVTLVIIAIVVSISIPAFSRWLPDYRLKGAAQDLASNLQLTKMQAISKAIHHTVCFNLTIGGKTYDYVVFQDNDADLEYDNGEKVIIKRSWAEDGYEGVGFDTAQGGGDGLTFASNDNGLPAVSFKPSGIPVSNTGGMGMGTAFLKNTRNHKKKVVLSLTGNVSIRDY